MPSKLKYITRQSGVSLIELIIVLAISALLASIALAGLSGGSRRDFDNGVNQTLDGLRQLQNEANSGKGPGVACSSSNIPPRDNTYEVTHGCLDAGKSNYGANGGHLLGDILLGRAAVFSNRWANMVDEVYDSDSQATYNAGLLRTSVNGKPATGAYYQFQVAANTKVNNQNGDLPIVHDAIAGTGLPGGLLFTGAAVCSVDDSSTCSAAVDSAVIVFARLYSGSGQTSSSALPYVFPGLASFAEGDFDNTVNYKSPRNRDTYMTSPDPQIIKLNFESKVSSKYKATIQINTATGAIEVAK